MDPDSPATKRRRIEDTGSNSAEFQHQSQHHNTNAKTAKTDLEPPSTSGASSGDFRYTASPNPTTMTISSPIRFQDFLTETTGETRRPEESEGPGPNKTEAEEDVNVRERHNSIGRRYRNKLNEQFDNLQALLSQQSRDGEDDNGDRESQEPDDDSNNNNNTTTRDSSSSPTLVKKCRKGRGINKASLLEMAKVRIETLTEQREMLIAEVEQLEKELAEEGAKKAGGRHDTC
ncbi:hypothetical protein B0H65DRAFT_177135 [Neurospora tetraspora]|uniref:BHLH domain-containing protein n=1 Tax=Neurospora tetraspora TaxID=94610 RepID=A0AAE0JII9_9PEZI|nr:hypothetical protein B0H65DRAFT_177135 [Neurospora tetraspora]